MKRFFVTAAVLGLAFVARVSFAADTAQDAKKQTVTGVLIDAKCGADKKEADAAKHPAACVLKCANGGQGLVLISGDKTYKLDDKGATLAKDYISKANAKTKVQVQGTVKDDTIAVTSIKAAEEKKS